MKTVILAGGFGTRLAEATELKPKPMVEVGGRPMLWHVMKIYGAQGFREFVIALGYKGEVIKSYFLNYRQFQHSLTVKPAKGHVQYHGEACEDWTVHLVDTGEGTQSGGRLKRLSEWLGNETFMMTYGDGVADVNISRLVEFHRAHGKLATVTAVRPPSRFGGLVLDGNHVTEFVEKSAIGEGWINGGFFVLEPGVLDYIRDDASIFERDPLENLASDGQLVAYHHESFWHSMDTLRDVRALNTLWESGDVPWRVWQ